MLLNGDKLGALGEALRRYHQEGQGRRSRQQAKTEVIELLKPIITGMARGLARRASDPVDDLVQVGHIGVLKALERYKLPADGEAKPRSFLRYARTFAMGEMRHHLRDKATLIKSPRAWRELYYRLQAGVRELTISLGRVPSDLELADLYSLPVEVVQEAWNGVDRRVLSLDTTPENEAFGSAVDALVDDQSREERDLQETRMVIDAAISRLPRRLGEMVRLYYLESWTQTRIAEHLNVSQMQVSRGLRKATTRLGTLLEASPVF